MKSELLVFGSKDFNNTIQEIKKNLDFSIVYFDFNKPISNVLSSITCIIIDNQIYKDIANLDIITNFKKPIILLQDSNSTNLNISNNIILLPISLSELKTKIVNIIAKSNFTFNSSVKIKDYILDKNTKKLRKLNNSISLTEREVQLIELLFTEKRTLSKSFILKKIWNYSESADSHTVETHIYRLRKKIYTKFNDEKFILNFEKGYTI